MCRRFVQDMELKKQNLTVEVGSVRTMLERVLDHWRSYRSRVVDLQPWLKEAELVLQQQDHRTKLVS